MSHVLYLFRKPSLLGFNIETVFNQVIAQLPGDVQASSFYCSHARGIWGRALNYHFTERLVFSVHLLLFGALARLLIGPTRTPGRRSAPVAPAPEPGFLRPAPTL
jgi:hypothetical protein